MKYSVITYIFNNYEQVHEIESKDENAEYILVTDNKNLTSDTWTIIYEPLLDTDKLTGIAKTFIVKYNAYKYVSNEIYIRLDSQITITSSLNDIVSEFNEDGYDIGVIQHAYTLSFAQEYYEWEYYRKHEHKWRKRFFEQINNYDYSREWKGLFGTTVSICRKTKAMSDFFDEMLKLLFIPDTLECDNNDQCYMTLLLMTKYNNFIKTKIISWTIILSNIMHICHHGTLEINDYLEGLFNEDEFAYWRGEIIGKIDKFEKCKLLK